MHACSLHTSHPQAAPSDPEPEDTAVEESEDVANSEDEVCALAAACAMSEDRQILVTVREGGSM